MEDKDLPIGDIDFVSSEDYDSKQDSLSLFVLHIITTYITSDIFQYDHLTNVQVNLMLEELGVNAMTKAKYKK